MATIVWKQTKESMGFFDSKRFDTKRNPETWIIAKGNWIDGFEAEE